jgi:hypothetical protein
LSPSEAKTLGEPAFLNGGTFIFARSDDFRGFVAQTPPNA